jgi:hypothetical protein
MQRLEEKSSASVVDRTPVVQSVSVTVLTGSYANIGKESKNK